MMTCNLVAVPSFDSKAPKVLFLGACSDKFLIGEFQGDGIFWLALL
jgi:hypothetical protein